ncbi:MFS transporter [Rubrivivax albus]|nr:MFS transporter [Rubrivivax albus]
MTAPLESPRTHWPAVTAVMAGGLAIALNVGKVPVALPTLRSELDLSLVQAGWVASMLVFLAFLGATFTGMWVGRLGALRMVLGGLVICAGASLIAPLAPGWWPLIGSRLLEGLGFMVVAVASPALVTAATSPGDRRFALGLWSTYMPAGASMAMLASPWLLPRTGWTGLWFLAAAGLLLAAAAVAGQRRHYAAAAPGHAANGGGLWATARGALAQPLPWLLALSFGVWAMQHFALIVWMPTYLQEQRGAGAGATAVLTGLMLLACVPGNLLGGWLVQQEIPRGRLLLAAQLCTGAGALVYSTEALPDPLRYAAAVFVSFAGGVIPAAVMASSTVLARSPQQIGTLQGLYMQGAQLGQVVGTPLIAAVVASSGQWSSALAVTASAAAAGVLMALAAGRLEARMQGHPG